MSHLDHLKKEADLNREKWEFEQDSKYELFVVNDLLQKFGKEYLDWLHIENEQFSKRREYQTIIRPIPVKAAQ